jgi:hypothetical protein
LGFSASNTGVTTSGTQLNAGDTHVYTITVTATIAVTPQTNGDCASGGGFGNTASVITNHAVPSATVCALFSTITLVKKVINNDGGTLQPSDVVLTAAGPATISGHAPVASAIPAGQYTLSESSVPGYTTTGFDCGATVNVAAGANVVCTIVNDDIALASEPPAIPPVVELPKTGIDVGMMLRWAILLMTTGAALAVATSRRRRRTSWES